MKTARDYRIAAHHAQMRSAAMEWRGELLEPNDHLLGQKPGEQAKFYLDLAISYRNISQMCGQSAVVDFPI